MEIDNAGGARRSAPDTNSTGKEKASMPVNNPKELFAMFLSDLRHVAERTTKIFQELGRVPRIGG
jgi:hypothetical protein